MNSTKICCVLWVMAVSWLAAAADVTLRNGGFEEEPVDGLPPGWQLWGHDAKRDRHDFAVDSQVAHSGQRSLRILHPRGAHGYIVTAVRDNLIPVQSNNVYCLSFYAKTDRPGEASVHVEGQQKGNPQGAKTVFEKCFSVGTAWQKYEFSIAEGVNFFRDEFGFLMLAIHAVATDAAQPTRTLWIDDVAVDEWPAAPGTVRLLNPRTVAYAPLQHRLAAGDALDVTIHAGRTMRPVTRLAGGVSFHRASGYMGLPYDRGGDYRMTPWQEEAIRGLRLPFTRFYAVGDETYPVEQSIDKIVKVLARCGIPQRETVLEFETQGAATKLSPETWVRGVKHSLAEGYGFHRWEVSNEPWGKPAFAAPDDYVAHLKEVSAAVRAAQPEALIGVGIHYADLHWGNYVLAAAAGHYDYVCGHWYSFIDVKNNPLETVAACENYRILDEILRMNALLRRYNPGRDVRQYDTEWSLHSSAGGTVAETRENGNIVGALHRAVRLIYYLREDIVSGASAWEMFSSSAKSRWNALGLIAPDEERMAAIYWVHRFVNEYAGDEVLAIEGTTPYCVPAAGARGSRQTLAGPMVPLVAMSDAGGKTITVIAANVSSARSVPCTLRLDGFAASAVKGARLSQDDEHAHPLLRAKEDLVSAYEAQLDDHGNVVRCEVPPRSVVFLRIMK